MKSAQSKKADTLSSVVVDADAGMDPLPNTAEEAAKMWRKQNKACGSAMFWCGEGPQNEYNKSVHRCAIQPLTGDWTRSTKCRVTDAWMLEGTKARPTIWWVHVQVKLMEAKAQHFQR